MISRQRVVGLVAIVGIIAALLVGIVLNEGEWESRVPLSGAPREGTQTEIVEGNSVFAFDLYQALREEEGNLFFSPYSISLALAMTYSGARGKTADQMADTLSFLLEQGELHRAFKRLDTELAARGEGAGGKEDEGFRLSMVNAIWGQKGYNFLDAFLNVLAENYGAGLRLLDFIEETEESRRAINDWVSDQTEGRIDELIPEGVIDEWTRLVLTNAIYFAAQWQHPFEEPTREDTFYLLDGNRVRVPMMRQTQSLGYAEGEGYQAVELPYDGGELSMVVLLPNSGGFRTFEQHLDAQRVSAIVDALQTRSVRLTMPRFEFESDFDLKQTLQAMGMTDAFVPPCSFTGYGADFTGMTDKRELYITDVVHKAFVAVDEEGTEAAATTGVIMGFSMPVHDVEVTVDCPFIFLIRDIDTGVILFVGRVLNPDA